MRPRKGVLASSLQLAPFATCGVSLDVAGRFSVAVATKESCCVLAILAPIGALVSGSAIVFAAIGLADVIKRFRRPN